MTKTEVMKTHEELVAEWFEDPKVREAYEALEGEFGVFEEKLKENMAGKVKPAVE